MDSSVLAAMLEDIQRQGHNIDSVTVIRNGYLVADASHCNEHPPPIGQVRWYGGGRLTDWVEPDDDDIEEENE